MPSACHFLSPALSRDESGSRPYILTGHSDPDQNLQNSTCQSIEHQRPIIRDHWRSISRVSEFNCDWLRTLWDEVNKHVTLHMYTFFLSLYYLHGRPCFVLTLHVFGGSHFVLSFEIESRQTIAQITYVSVAITSPQTTIQTTTWLVRHDFPLSGQLLLTNPFGVFVSVFLSHKSVSWNVCHAHGAPVVRVLL